MTELKPLMKIAVDVGPPQDLGEIGGVTRRCVPIIGGTVSGGFEGRVLAGGADWQVIAPDGQIDISAHYTLEIGGALVEVQSNGLRHAAEGGVYFRTAMRFHTASDALAHLNRILAVSTGSRQANQVMLEVFQVL